MPEQAIRFSILNQRGLRSATWICIVKTHKDDFYLKCRELGGDVKVSFHQLERWHIRFEEKFPKKKATEDSSLRNNRFISVWSPIEIFPGFFRAFTILVPERVINVPKKKENKSLIWIPSPPKGKTIEICILVTLPKAKFTSWPGDKSMGTRFVGKIELDSGKKVWIVYRVIELPSLKHTESGKPTFFGSSTEQDFKESDLRALIIIDIEDGSKGLLEAIKE
jgi:hypothetical protein